MRFEDLPNELILNVFQYFDAGELLRIFYDLNTRLNDLIKSIHNLSLIISEENYHEFHILSSYLSTLKIDGYLELNLFAFNAIRNLILINPTDQLLTQFGIYPFAELEYLSVNCVGPSSQISFLYQLIFSNYFPRLEFYSNLSCETIQSIGNWTGSPHLRKLKLGYIKVSVIQTILSLCPNLYHLECGIIIPSDLSTRIKRHLKLKHLILKTSYRTLAKNENLPVLEDLFSCLPNLEKLSFHRRDNISIIRRSFLKYHWLSSIISLYFPLLRKFDFYFHLFRLRNGHIVIGPCLQIILEEMKENFQKIHSNRYQARLIID